MRKEGRKALLSLALPFSHHTLSFNMWSLHFAHPIHPKEGRMMQTPIRIHISFQFGPRVTYVGHSLLLNVIATFSQFPQLDVFSK